jgi:cyanophycinase
LEKQSRVEGNYLVVVGGAEDRIRQKLILRKFVELSGGAEAKILIISIASETPEIVHDTYRRIFENLGVAEIRGMTAVTREEIRKCDAASLLDGITGIYMTGGDQLRLASLIGGTEFQMLFEHHLRAGCTLGGTSAGASAISDTMIIDWEPSDQPLAGNVRLSAGLGVLRNIIIDQHFTQRNRLSRLITSVAYQPGYLGIGIDEDTAIVVSPDGLLEVMGMGTVTIVDGSEISYCNITEVSRNEPFSIVGLKIHVLSPEHGYDLGTRSAYDIGNAHLSAAHRDN